jgi:hypothetical protein
LCACGFSPPVGRYSGPVGVDEKKVLERTEVPELPFNKAFMHAEAINLPTQSETQIRRRAPVPGPTSFAISHAADIKKVTGICSLCDHYEDGEVSDDEEEEIN